MLLFFFFFNRNGTIIYILSCKFLWLPIKYEYLFSVIAYRFSFLSLFNSYVTIHFISVPSFILPRLDTHLCCFWIYILWPMLQLLSCSYLCASVKDRFLEEKSLGQRICTIYISWYILQNCSPECLSDFNSSINRLIKTSSWMSVAICQPALPTTAINTSFPHWKGLY